MLINSPWAKPPKLDQSGRQNICHSAFLITVFFQVCQHHFSQLDDWGLRNA